VSDFRELYQEVILDHSKSPRNYRALTGAAYDAQGYNPLCGDQVHVWIAFDGDTVKDVSFLGTGCAISKASASMMTQAVKGRSKKETAALFTAFHRLVTGEAARAGEDPEALGKLAVFGGVSEFPVRVKCASLAWHTLKAALEGAQTPVSTE
jgi:nitrogen fixation NifU-like protein